MKNATQRSLEWKRANPEKVRAQSRRRYQRHKERICQYGKDWRAANADRMAKWTKNRDLKKNYGITLEDFNRMCAYQKNKCAICGYEGRLCVDHDHLTGAVRGLLCSSCNSAIGLFHESVASLAAAIAYLDSYFSKMEGARTESKALPKTAAELADADGCAEYGNPVAPWKLP